MAATETAETLARIWIESWNAGAPERIPLAQHFVHTSPFGRIDGKDVYLDWMQSATDGGVAKLKILRTMEDSSSNQATIHFEMETASGPVQACDWIVAENGEITEIHSFYDATNLR